MKVLDENDEQWPYIIEGISFAHRVSRHSSTMFSPFRLVYNREPVLPANVKYNLVPDSQSNIDENPPFDLDTFNTVLAASESTRTVIRKRASENIEKAQQKQNTYYDQRFCEIPSCVKIGANRRDDRKGGMFSFQWRGPYILKDISNKGQATLQCLDGKLLKTKHNICQKVHEDPTNENLEQADDNEVPIEDICKDNSDVSTSTEEPYEQDNQNYWDKLSNEVVEKILLYAIASSRQMCQNYHSIIQTDARFKIIIKARITDILLRKNLFVKPLERKNIPVCFKLPKKNLIFSCSC